MIFELSPLKLEKIKHGFKTLAECGGIRGVDNTSSSFFFQYITKPFSHFLHAMFLAHYETLYACYNMLLARYDTLRILYATIRFLHATIC
jgi:hypothetical protein